MEATVDEIDSETAFAAIGSNRREDLEFGVGEDKD